MSETTPETPAESVETTEFAPITSQDEFDRRIAERINRTKAQFKDYADLKQKAEEFDRLQEAQKTETQKQTEELSRWQTEAERWRGAAVASTVKALAASDFADPDDAVRNLDPAKYLGVDGVIDEDAIRSDLGSLLEAKPHYRRSETSPRVPAPNPAQGASGGTSPSDPATQFASILAGHIK